MLQVKWTQYLLTEAPAIHKGLYRVVCRVVYRVADMNGLNRLFIPDMAEYGTVNVV